MPTQKVLPLAKMFSVLHVCASIWHKRHTQSQLLLPSAVIENPSCVVLSLPEWRADLCQRPTASTVNFYSRQQCYRATAD